MCDPCLLISINHTHSWFKFFCIFIILVFLFAQAEREVFLICLKQFCHVIPEKVTHHFQKTFSVWCMQWNKL